MFIEIVKDLLDAVSALVAAAKKDRIARVKGVATVSELRLTTLQHGPRPRLRDGDSVP